MKTSIDHLAPPPSQARRAISILGATGSIGRSTADLLCAVPEAFSVAAVAGGRDVAALAAVARRLGASFAALADPDGYGDLKQALAGTGSALAPERRRSPRRR